MFKVNPAAYTGVTALPSQIAEKHLLLAGAAQLKIIIYAFHNVHDVFDLSQAAKNTGLGEDEALDALNYWIDCGLLLNEKDAPALRPAADAEKKQEAVREEKQKKDFIKTKPTRLSYDAIIARINESSDVRTLFFEAEQKLNRPLGNGDKSSLLLLYDYYGLPVEIILTVCEYARTHGKANNMNYIYTIGVDWSNREIDSIESADDELKQIEAASSLWKEFAACTDIKRPAPTTAQMKYLRIWTDEWHFPLSMIVLAFDEMSKNTDGKISFPYMNTVLATWHKKGVKTPQDVEENRKSFIENKEKKAAEKLNSPYNRKTKPVEQYSTPASYDIERAEQRSNTTIPKFKKREKR